MTTGSDTYPRTGGALDATFPRRLRDVLVEEGHTGERHFVPVSGWRTFRVRNADDVDAGLWLLRVSHL